MRRAAISCTALLALLSGAASTVSYSRLGSSQDVSVPPVDATLKVGMMGGGTDVDALFEWFCSFAGNGDFVVIRAEGTDAYNPYIKGLCPKLNSVATLILPTKADANDPKVKATLLNAEAIFIAGGDQNEYITNWSGTSLQAAVQAQLNAGVPLGGTSAGCDVLSQFVYTAADCGGITSAEALENPYDSCMTFSENFLSIPYIAGVMADTHFVTRGRMGRDLAFMGRVDGFGWSGSPQNIAIDEATALLLSSTGVQVVGSSTAYFINAPGAPQTCKPKTSLTYQNVAVTRVNATTGSFTLADAWAGKVGTVYNVSATAGVMSSTQPGGSLY